MPEQELEAPACTMRIPDLIMKKRNGGELKKDEIDFFIRAICERNNNSAIQESQIGAMLMAIFFNSMNFEESFLMTKAMMESGEKFSWKKHRDCVVDKHSTGGVGDKISLPLAPALAALGLKIPMISGRGLGFTGGTLDKLESIPGFQVSCSKSKIEDLVDNVGLCIVGQTEELNPADRILYATRDITSTVDCIPLIACSIVSKKAIEDLDALVLDVKIGKAAFMKKREDAEILANYMLQICKKLGLKAAVFLTYHDNPLGWAIGNQIEIEETIECLHGKVAKDIEELTSKYGGFLLMQASRANSMEEGAQMIMGALKDGSALEKFRQMLIAQGVSEHIAYELCIKRNYDEVFGKKSKFTTSITATQNGYIKSIDAITLGQVASKLGAGRSKAGDKISYEVGFRLLKTIGDQINSGEAWLEAYHNSVDFTSHYANTLNDCVEYSATSLPYQSLIAEILE